MKKKEIKNKVFLWAAMIGLIGTLGITSFQTAAFAEKTQELQERLDKEVQEGIAGKIFRLHVVANSDKEEDQELKLDVKKTVVDYLSRRLGSGADLEETREYVLENLPEIEQAALKTIEEQGKDYPVSAVVEKTYFPDKTYGDCTFPAGEYEALNIRIGKGEGKNWWCVLYPSLCFIDDTWGIVSREKKEELREILTEEEFRAVLEDPEEKKKVDDLLANMKDIL